MKKSRFTYEQIIGMIKEQEYGTHTATNFTSWQQGASAPTLRLWGGC